MKARKKHSLSSKEKIKSKKDFERLYSAGKIILTGNQKLKAIYISEPYPEDKIKIAAVVSKKLGKAVWRNRVKRLIKESYRLNKLILFEKFRGSSMLLKVIISAHLINERNYKSIKLEDIMPEVIELMKKIPNVNNKI
jgi:ribonuclease P protein component